MKRLLSLYLILLCTGSSQSQDVTYYKDIYPLIQAKCAACHQPGESAPFPLLTYGDAAKRASFIKKVVQRKYMPPWTADRQYTHFANERGLSDAEIALIVKWVDDKTPEGKKSDIRPNQKTIVAGTKFNRKPDLVLMAGDTFHLAGDNTERFIIFKIPFELKDSFNVEAIEFFSNNKKMVHHANYAIHGVPDNKTDIRSTVPYINLTEDDRSKLDAYKPYRKTISYYGGWIPGAGYEYFPGEFGWIMPARGVILLTVHFAPSATEENSVCGVNLFFKKTPVVRKMKVISFGSGGIGEAQIDPPFFIKANTVKTFRLDVTNPSGDQSLLYVWPHMHLLGKEYKAFIITPAGDTLKLVHIPAWDFRWQEIYRFRHPLKVPKGSVIHIEGTYDNTADNPSNPNNPPKGIFSMGDMRTTDEMMTLMMGFLPYQEGDEQVTLE